MILVKLIRSGISHLKNLRLNVIQAGLAVKFQPNKTQTEELELFGENFGRQFLLRAENE